MFTAAVNFSTLISTSVHSHTSRRQHVVTVDSVSSSFRVSYAYLCILPSTTTLYTANSRVTVLRYIYSLSTMNFADS